MLRPALCAILILLSSVSFSHANAFKNALIDGVKFLDDIPEVAWYRVEGKSLIIGWKGLPQRFPHTNRRAAMRATISTGTEIHVWAVRHNQKKWKVGNGQSHICSVTAKNGRVQTDTCPR
jgi:hypothetical protein